MLNHSHAGITIDPNHPGSTRVYSREDFENVQTVCAQPAFRLIYSRDYEKAGMGGYGVTHEIAVKHDDIEVIIYIFDHPNTYRSHRIMGTVHFKEVYHE